MHLLDPDYLPTTVGTLARFILNSKAEIDGLMTVDGTEIHTPPHLSAELARALTIGSSLAVRGVKPRGCDIIVAVAIDSEGQERILDNGPEHHEKRPPSTGTKIRGEPTVHEGEIQCLIHGSKGEVRGALLKDGIVVRWPPHATKAFADLLAVDGPLGVRGSVITTSVGSMINAESMGRGASTLKPIPKPPEKKDKKHPPVEHHDRRS